MREAEHTILLENLLFPWAIYEKNSGDNSNNYLKKKYNVAYNSLFKDGDMEKEFLNEILMGERKQWYSEIEGGWYSISSQQINEKSYFICFFSMEGIHEEEYKKIIDNSKEMLLVIQQDKIVFFNKAFSENTGINSENINNMKLEDLIDKVVNKKELENKKFNQEFIEPYQFKFNTKFGNEKWLEISTRNFSWENKEAVLCTFDDVTLKKVYEEQLKRSEKSKESLIKSMNDLIIVLDLDYKFKEYYTPNPEELYINPQYFIGKNFRDIDFPKEAHDIIVKALNKLIESRSSQEVEYNIPMENGKKWYNLHITLVDNTYNKEKSILCVARDITKLKEYQKELDKERERLAHVIEGTNAGTWELNIKTLESKADEKCLKMLGYSKKDSGVSDVNYWKKIVHPDDLDFILENIRKHFRGETEYFEEEYRMKNKSGNYVWILSRGKILSFTEASDSPIMFGTNMDINARKEAEKKIVEQAIRDPLTNIYNRRYVFERLNEIKEKYKRDREKFSVIILDIDFFKRINDEFGHLAGDHVLQEFTKLLKKSLRSIDILGRYGGEEFIVVMTDCQGEDAYDRMLKILEKIRNTLFVYNGNHMKITFTAGISGSYDFDYINLEKILDLADRRLYKGKHTGRNKIVWEKD